MKDIRLGIWLDAGSRMGPLDEQLGRHLELARVAESSGFESVWIGETFTTGMPSPLQWLAALALRTTLRLGTGVVLLPAWQPIRLAIEAAVLDGLSGGRLALGVGVGRPALQRRFGHAPATVATYADEVLQVLRVMWAGGDRFSGSRVRVEGRLDPLPVQVGGPPLWVAGNIGATIIRAAAHGDGWYAPTTASFDRIALQADRYRLELAARGSTDPARIAANRLVLVADTDDAADELGARLPGADPPPLRHQRQPENGLDGGSGGAGGNLPSASR